MGNQQNMKSKFLLNEFFILSISGALQRANVYSKTATSQEKEQFKKELRQYLNTVVEQYFSPVSEENHLKNIAQLAEFTSAFKTTLKYNGLTFGVSQHILNLFLKYIWCLKLIPDPPHFPIDGKIQDQLNTEAERLNIGTRAVSPWTKLTNAAPYLQIIQFARTVQHAAQKDGVSLAEYELAFYLKPS